MKKLFLFATVLLLSVIPLKMNAHIVVPFECKIDCSYVLHPFIQKNELLGFNLFIPCPSCGQDDWEYLNFGSNYIEYICQGCGYVMKKYIK